MVRETSNDWRERDFDGAKRAALEAYLSGHPLTEGVPAGLLARLLLARGIDAGNVEAFLDPALSRLLPPEALPGIPEAVKVIAPFVRNRQKIVVFGDYDADGVCASAILVTTLERLGGRAFAFIPRRQGEGYGMTTEALRRLKEEHPDVALVITVDNGITAAAEITRLRSQFVRVVVTDHHLPPAPEKPGQDSPIPVADAPIVNPKLVKIGAEERPPAPGAEDLCGAGVALFLARALDRELRREAEEKGFLKPAERYSGMLFVLAGMATVADLVPLVNQNRILVSAALALFPTNAPVGLRELYARAARRTEELSARDFAFLFVPRLNAAGRMKAADLAYMLLMEKDREFAREFAQQVDTCNVDRKTREQVMYADALEQYRAALAAAGEKPLDALVVAEARRPIGRPAWHSGVAGIVAARLLEEAHVPVAVIVGDHASARAPAGYNVRAALDAASDALVRHGGHAAAGGFTVKPGRLDDFIRIFASACAGQKALTPGAAATAFDGWVDPEDLTMALYRAIQRLEPMGEGNPEPLFGVRGVRVAEARSIGQEARHATLTFSNPHLPRAVWWNHGADVEVFRAHPAARYDILFALMTSDYGTDRPHVELRLQDVRLAR